MGWIDCHWNPQALAASGVVDPLTREASVEVLDLQQTTEEGETLSSEAPLLPGGGSQTTGARGDAAETHWQWHQVEVQACSDKGGLGQAQWPGW
jgi:hypothetical protein